MNLYPLVANTVALWQLQGDLKDSSGNGLDLTAVNVTTNAGAATPPFTALANKTNGTITPDGCILGIDLDTGGTTKLMAPNTSLLRLTGEMTIEWLMVQKFTFTLAYFTCADPAGRSGGAGPDRIGSLYTLWSDSGNPAISDEHIGSGAPSAGYGLFPGYNDHVLFNWADNGEPIPGDWHPHAFAYVRDASGNWKTYRDGVTVGAGVLTAGANTATGLERFFIGAIENGAGGANGLIGSVRVMNVARSATAIASDAALVMAACGGGGESGADAGGGNTSSANAQGLVYDAVAAAQFGISLRQSPRS